MIQKKHFAFSLFAALITGVSVLAQQKTVTIGAVNNPAMIELKKLSPKFEAQNVLFEHHPVEFDVGVLRFELGRELLEFDHCWVIDRSDSHSFLLGQDADASN